MRRIEQPGPPVAERIQCVEARGRAFTFTMQPGQPLLEAARRGFAEAGFAGGVLNIKGGALGPFAYVMPALSKTPEHAAFYSDTYRPVGVTRLKLGAMTLGERDGAPFFHCHALWSEADGRDCDQRSSRSRNGALLPGSNRDSGHHGLKRRGRSTNHAHSARAIAAKVYHWTM